MTDRLTVYENGLVDVDVRANRAQEAAQAIAGRSGCSAVTIVIDPEGAFQIRGAPLGINVLVGVLQRAIIFLTVGFPPVVAPGRFTKHAMTCSISTGGVCDCGERFVPPLEKP